MCSFTRDASHIMVAGGKDVPSVSHGTKGDYGEESQTYELHSLLMVSGYRQLWVHQKWF